MDVKVHISFTRYCLVVTYFSSFAEAPPFRPTPVISQTAEYALRAIVYLADQQQHPRTTAQIAEATQVPAGYLAKIMQSLGRAHLVHSQRGLNGGFVLSKNPSDISILSVVQAVDVVQRYHSCPLNLPSHATQLCPLHSRLDEAAALIEQSFQDSSIADLLSVPSHRKPLCRFPCVSPRPSSDSRVTSSR